MDFLLDILLDAFLDTLKIAPFLLVTYIIMEWLEHRTEEKTIAMIRRTDKLGPLLGGLLGVLPQCGFSATAATFYGGRVITAGTLLAVFLSTSDEMLAIMISNRIDAELIAQILVIKMIFGVVFGFLTDLLFTRFNMRRIGEGIRDICAHDNCGCDDEPNIFVSALRHAAQILLFIFVISVLLGGIIEGIGEEALAAFILNRPLAGQLLASVIGLIPNCAASIVITQLYLEGAMSFGAMMSGLLTGAGIGLLVLFRSNRNLRENIQLTVLLYAAGVIGGLLIQVLGIAPVA